MEPRRRDTRSNHLSRIAAAEGSESGRALVFGPYLRPRSARSEARRVAASQRSPEARLDEAIGLAQAIGLTIVDSGIVPITDIRPATYIGSGKVDEIAGLVKSNDAGLVIMDCALSPVQQRNLERTWNAKVLDRTGLILEIFGRRAHTREGVLQVEHAHLTYQKSRLVRSWTHLERQRGGFGFLGGPGETQLEADRRMIQERIARIEAELEKVKRRRSLHRESRKHVPYPIVALVGYTNAGKSTLFNQLTRADVLQTDMLFATLDPTLREVKLPHGNKIILSDTVGFISDLPTMLVAAFRATLEEVVEADVILHVRDISHEDSEAQMSDVEHVLETLGIDRADRRLIEVWNKIDRLDEQGRERLANLARRHADAEGTVLVSGLTGESLDQLIRAIEDRLSMKRVVLDLVLDPADGAGVSWLHRNTEVLEKSLRPDGRYAMTIRADLMTMEMVKSKFRPD